MTDSPKNQLANETSPYLLQHADNPVWWYPWGEEALRLAAEQHKPILLSIGYSACHWCHVMAHESFEDEETAALMNELFINIKVDREERPDLDKIYQLAHQMLTQRGGGWPLTMILTPDKQVPFYAGTYFPKEPRGRMPTFKSMMQQVHDAYVKRGAEIEKQNQSLESAMQNMYVKEVSGDLPPESVFAQARQQLLSQFDKHHGGFGTAPKFPHVSSLERLQRDWARSENEVALHAAHFTLEKMALGGMNDQLGGGFCRYSVDDYWMIPHFEKMLYDNGILLAQYAQAYALNQQPLFAKTCHETAQWVMREMQSPEGGYVSSYDADSEGEEGKFYVWNPEQVRGLLNEREFAVVSKHFGLDQPANFEGQWNFHVYQKREDLLDEFPDFDTVLGSAKTKLMTAREQRVKPGRDDKVLTSWNGLMIKGMALAARYLSEDSYAESATRALRFIQNTLWVDGRLLATYKDNKAHLMAYLDDYAYLLDAILELLQVRWNSEECAFAQQVADVVLDRFEDKEQGGFWFVADDHEQLMQRPKVYSDEATPAGNGVAAFALQRLGYLVGEPRYLEAAERCLKNASAAIQEMPYAHCTMLKAYEEFLDPPQTVIIRASTPLSNHAMTYAPFRQRYLIGNDVTDLPAGLASKTAQETDVAYICVGMTCGMPITDLEGL